jgi:hypothetical protein
MELNQLLLMLFFGAVYLCSSIVPALAPSEVKSTKNTIILLLKLTFSATFFLIISNYSTNLIGALSAIILLIILYLLKDNQQPYYLLPALAGVAIITNNYYILTTMTTTLFLKGMTDYADLRKMKWSDKRITMFIYLVVVTAAVVFLIGVI